MKSKTPRWLALQSRNQKKKDSPRRPSAAEPQPKLGISPAKAQRPQRSEKPDEIIRKNFIFPFELGDFAPLERQDKPGRSNILKGGYLVNCPFDK
jgi:hypothetical protein